MVKASSAQQGALEAEELMTRARAACVMLKAMAHETRLAILCVLSQGPRSVSELEQILGERQAAVSQQLARLRLERIVTTERAGATIRYSLASPEARLVLDALYAGFCVDQPSSSAPAPALQLLSHER